jgi:hypothetical protein
MINKLRPHAAHLLVALKKTIPAVLLLGTLSLVSAPTARAQILFSVDAFTTDLLTITLSPSVLYFDIYPSATAMLRIEAPGADWIVGSTTVTGGGPWGSLAFSGAGSLSGFEYVVIGWQGEFSVDNASDLTSPMSFSFAGTGAFQPSVVDTLTLAWGDLYTTYAYQSSVSAPWAGVAVPEPSSYALLGGLAMLGLAGTRRRRTAEANA